METGSIFQNPPYGPILTLLPPVPFPCLNSGCVYERCQVHILELVAIKVIKSFLSAVLSLCIDRVRSGVLVKMSMHLPLEAPPSTANTRKPGSVHHKYRVASSDCHTEEKTEDLGRTDMESDKASSDKRSWHICAKWCEKQADYCYQSSAKSHSYLGALRSLAQLSSVTASFTRWNAEVFTDETRPHLTRQSSHETIYAPNGKCTLYK